MRPETSPTCDHEDEIGSARPFVCSLGLICLLSWYYVVFFSTVVHYSTRGAIPHLNSTYFFACCGLIAGFGCLAVPWGALRARMGRGRAGEGGPSLKLPWGAATAASALVMSCCTVVLYLVDHGFFMQPWCSVASFLCGAAAAVLTARWARIVVFSEARPIAMYLGLVFVVAATLYAIVVSLPSVVGACFCAMLPPMSAALMWVSRIPEQTALPSGFLRADGMRAGVRGLVGAGLLSFAESLAVALFMDLDPGAEGMKYGMAFLAATLVAVGFACILNLFLRGADGADRVSHMSSLVMLAAFMTAFLFRGHEFVSACAAMVAHMFVLLLVFTIVPRVVEEHGLPVVRTVGMGLGIASVGCLAGTLLGSAAESFVRPVGLVHELGFATVVMVSQVSFVFLANGGVLARLTDRSGAGASKPRKFQVRCQEVARRYGLSPKETEVMVLAAKGRSNERIQEALGIAAGTVNTHISHIYKKLDVHDRQGMIDVIEGAGGD